MSEEPIVINDRRGQNKPKPIPAVVVEDKSEGVKEEHTWKDQECIVAMTQIGDQTVLVGRALGLRDDDRLFVADYLLSARWPVGLDWVKEALKRLDSFLNCDCGGASMCSDHRVNLEQWQRADLHRLDWINTQPPGRALETLMRAEQAQRQSRVIAPR